MVVVRAVLKGRDFFFLLRTALQDRPKGPPTANRQPPTATNRQPPTAANRQRRPTANGQPLPTATNHQPPATNHQPPPTTTNRHQPPITNHQSPTTNRRQPPPTATNHQLPTANRQPPPTAQPPTANRHQPWLSTWSARGLFWENWFRNTFFFPLRTALVVVVGGRRGAGEWMPRAQYARAVGLTVHCHPHNCTSSGPLFPPLPPPTRDCDQQEQVAQKTWH